MEFTMKATTARRIARRAYAALGLHQREVSVPCTLSIVVWGPDRYADCATPRINTRVDTLSATPFFDFGWTVRAMARELRAGVSVREFLAGYEFLARCTLEDRADAWSQESRAEAQATVAEFHANRRS